MSKLMRVSLKLLDLFVVFMMTFGSPMAALAQDTGPMLMTDKTDYVPGDTVHISGLGFVAGNYFLTATYPDESTADWGPVVVDDTLIFSAASPEAVTTTGTYSVTAYAEDHITVIDSKSFTVTAPPPPPAEPELLPFIQSDKLDYLPGELVTLTGGNWQGDTQVRIFVNDDLGQTWSRDVIVDVAADGTITDSFYLPTWFVAIYKVVAGGQQTGRAVTTTFTDLNIGTYDQCSNDDGDGYASGDTGCRWINGNLQRNNSVYMEGDATVQRLWLTDLVPGSTHTVTLKYGTTKGGKHAYDFLTTWNWSEDWITLNDLCQALSGGGTINGCTTATQTTFAIPNDPNLTDVIEAPAGPDRLFTMAGGIITAASTPQIVSGAYTGDSETVITITYTVGPGTGSMCTTDNKGVTTCGIMLWFGAHVSVSGQWTLYNGTTGAGNIEGSPYHVALDQVDGAAVGQRDNQMQANVITYIPNGTIVLAKDAVPNDAQDFSFNLNNNSTIDFGTFYLDDDADATLPNSQTFSVPPGIWTAKEIMPLPDGWALTNLVCVDPTSNTSVDLATGTATINLASLETVTCTYTDTKALYLTVTKDASTSLTRTNTWTINKAADGEYWKFIGDPATSHSYTVSVDKSATDNNWAASGNITIANNTGRDAKITGLSDVISPDITAAVTCPVTFPYTLAAGAMLNCTYSASLPNADTRTNTVTVTTDGTNYVQGGTATAEVSFTNPTINEIGPATVNVTDTNGQSWGPVSDDANWTYTKDFACSTNLSDYTNGVDGDVYANVATITETGAYDNASVTVHCYAPVVSKVAAGGYNKAYTWTISKSPDAEYKLFAGQSVDHKYTVSVDHTVTDSGFVVSGTITVNNPNPNAAMTVDVADSVAGTAATINCGDGEGDTTLTVVAGESGACNYTATMTSATPGTNTATVTLNTYNFPATANYTFTAATSGYADVHVTDTNSGAWAASGDMSWTYDKTFACPTDPAAYINGVYTAEDYVNTATIAETGQSDTATVNLTCYAPIVSKTANASYDERHTWDITKSVTPTSQNGFAGDKLSWTWTVNLSETFVNEKFAVNGVITVVNPAPMVMTVALADVLDDGSTVTITADEDCAYAADNLVIPAGGTATCGYAVAPTDNTATKNTATATLNGIAFSNYTDVTFVKHVVNGSATVTDTQIGLNETVQAGGTYGPWTKTYDHTCSADFADYGADGTYSGGANNTATVTASDGQIDSANASTAYNCYAPVISKTAAGTYDERHEWTVKKTVSPTSQSGFAGDELSYTWDIEVTEEVFEENFKVAGIITVVNPAPMPMTIALADVLDVASEVTITPDDDCAYSEDGLTIPAGKTATCGYSFVPSGKTATKNTATATLNTIPFSAEATVGWTANVIRGEADLVDEHLNLNIHLTEGYKQTFVEKYTCSTATSDYGTNYTYDKSITNTAVVTSETVEESRSSATELIACYIPEISKTAAGTYGERHEWDVTKTVSPASQSAFAGDTVSYEWTVNVEETVFEENFVVTGRIAVVNHNPEDAMTVALSDVVDGTTATITACTGDADLTDGLTIAVDGTSVCDYIIGLNTRTPDTNTATAVLNGISYEATDPIEWTAAITRASVTLDDDQNPAFPLTISDGGTWKYTEQYTCSTDKSQYNAETHKYNFPDSNLATLKDGETLVDSDDASTAVDCYIPTISKTANGTYDEVHDWEVYKTGAAAQKKFAGQSASFSWTVRIDETTHGENYLVTGDITVVNPNPEDALTVALNDVLDDGSVAAIGPCTGGTLVGNVLTVPAGGTATCDYSVTPKGDLADFANALPTQVTMKVDYPESGDPAYFEAVTITGDGALNGVYEGWCIDQDHTIAQNTNYTANVFSSYEALPAGLVEHPENFDLVNWIINQDYVYKPAGGSLGNYTYGDVQRAIWELIDDSPFSTSGLNSWNQTRVNQIKAAAIANGDGFTPTCGDYVAVVLQPTGTSVIQAITIAQVTFASLGVDCATENAVTAVLNGLEFPASAQIIWTANPINPTATLDDTQNPAWPITVSADQTFTYADPQGYACPTDPAAYAGDGIAPVYIDSNTATITYLGGSKSSTASTTVTCYGPIVTKTAAAEWRKKYDWKITKTADPTSHISFAGDTFTSAYDVFVDQTITDYGFLASGVITIKNPSGSPGNMTVDVADMVSGGFAGTVDCDPATAGDQTSVTVATNATKTCTYTASLPDNTSRVNTATGTFNNIGFPATANVVFGDPIIEGYPTIKVTDSYAGDLGSASGDYTFEYDRTFTCSTNAEDYTNYADSDTYGNIATITETGASDDASVKVDCYIPEISKTAAGVYDERHEWDVEKTVSPVSQSAFAGDTVSYEWTVMVTEDVFEENFVASGQITIVNHNVEDAMTVAVSDMLSDETVATITTCTGEGVSFDAGSLMVPAGKTATCDYTAALTYDDVTKAPTNNTATAVLNGISYSASDPIEWTANVIRGSATLDDDQNPNLPPTITDGGTWKYPETYQCSTDKTLYEGDNTYAFGENNTATLTSGDFSDSATASTTVNCYVPAISKDANGTYDEVHDWEVFKSVNTGMQTAFAGEKKNFTWTVRVDETIHGEDYLVTGTITVVNPNPEDDLTVALSDALDDGSVAAIGPCTGGTWSAPNLTVPAGGTATCEYKVTPTGDMDVFNAALPATVTINSVNPGPDSYWLTTVSNDAALNGIYEAWCVDIDHTMNPGTNYTAAVYSSYEAYPSGLIEKAYDMDLVNWIINQDFVGKSATPLAGNYTYGDVQRAIWEIIEDNPTATTAGLGTWNQARVDQIEVLARASGQGFVPGCGDFVAVLLVPTGGQQPIAIAQVTFASLGLPCAESNSAKATLNGVDFLADAKILWTVNKINETASLDDDQKLDWPTTVSADTTFTYQDPQGYTCSTDPAAYTNGFYQYNESNTAVLTYQTGSDTAIASTAVQCYAPVVTKTAAGAYDERHEWDVEKSVDPLSQNAFAGDTVSYEWTVTVAESVFEENFVASGTISVKNPRPDNGDMTVKLTDVLSDGFVPTITGCTGGTWNAATQTVAVPPNTTAVCSYTASLTYSDDAAAPNSNKVDYELMAGTTHLTGFATAGLSWTANVIRGSATIDDDQNNTDFPKNITDGGTWKYTENYTCSTDPAAYTNGFYQYNESNTAIVTSGDERDRDSASTEVNCYWPQIDITKSGDELSKITDNVYYDITVYNNTPTDAGLRALFCTISDPTIGYNETVELASGAKDENLDIEFTIPTGASDPFKNTASVTCSPLNSTFSVSDNASWSTNLFQPAVEIIKTGPLYATSGDVITYSFTINNLSSSDSPNLILDTLVDDKIGDLKAAAVAAGCDNLVYNGTCTFTATKSMPDVGLQPMKYTNVVTVHYHPAGFPNDIWDDDDHTVTVTPRSQLTDTSFCPLPNNQFRLLYHLEVAPNIYRLQASNPGQWYFNGFYYGEPGSDFTMTLQIPYPFVTQEGAGVPIQVHDGTTLTSAGCYLPNPSLSGFTITTPALTPTSNAGNQIITPEDYDTKNLGNYTTVTVTGKVPATGMAYVTIHLDYGLKKTGGWKNPGTWMDNPVTLDVIEQIPDMQNQTGFGDGAVTIHGVEYYNFARSVGNDTAATTPSSYNELKKFAGFLGFIIDQNTEEGVANVQVVIYNSLGKVIATVYTDADGYYMYAYKHTAKSAVYTVKVPKYNKLASQTVKANGLMVANFDVP